jgi:hypothetical protein
MHLFLGRPKRSIVSIFLLISLLSISCAPPGKHAGSGKNKINGSEKDSSGTGESSEIKSGNGAGDYSCETANRACIGSILGRADSFTDTADSEGASPTNLVNASCDFSKLRPLRGTEKDAAPFLKACIMSAPAGGIVAIPAGTYTLYSHLTIDRGITLTTAGIPVTAPGCQISGACAVLRAGLSMQGLLDPKTRVGFLFRIAGTGTTIHHIVFDARKPARSDADRKLCATSGGIGWVGFWNTCADCKFTKNVVTNALCSSNMVVEESIRSEISHSVFSNAGTHGSRVADGLTILHADHSNISYNQFSNNADIDLVLGECPGCMIEMNRVTHYDNPAGDPWLSSAFGGIFLNAWPGTSGDYTGAILRDNYVDGGPSRSIGQGIAFGTYQWQFIFTPDPAMIKLGWSYPPRPTRGFTAYNNYVTNSQAGFVINKDVVAGTFGDNYASGNTGNNACIVSGGQRRDLYSYVMTSGAQVTFTGKSVGQAYFASADYHNQYPNDAPGCVTKTTNVKPAPNAAGAERIFRHIIKELYAEHLGRNAEPAAYANLLPQFAAGSATQLSLRNSILGSNEYCQRWLRGQYQIFLHRLPEPAAYKNWCGQITAKKITFDQIRNIIANSPEAVAKR